MRRVLSLTLTVAACQPHDIQDPINLREIYAGEYCVTRTPELRIVDNKADALAITGTNRTMGAKPAVLSFDDDDSHEYILLIAVGSKPTAGYRLRLQQTQVNIEDGNLYLPVTLSNPKHDMQAMVVTSPCMLLAIQRGNYQHITVEELGLSLELTGK